LTLEPATVTITGSSFIEEEKRVELVCSASSNLLNVTVTWNKGSTVLKTGISRLTLVFDKIHRNDTGNYTCTTQVKGLNGAKSHTTNIQVICK